MKVVFIGTYTSKLGHVNGIADGIYSADVSDDGELSNVKLAASIANPSFLALHPTLNILYAVSETDNYVVAYRIEQQRLIELNRKSSHGDSPCHIVVMPDARHLIVSNYGGKIAVFKCTEDGRLSDDDDSGAAIVHEFHGHSGVVAHRQERSHPHSSVALSNDTFAVADLGTDLVSVLQIVNDSLVSRQAIKLAAGAGPRHMVISQKHSMLFVLNELNSTVNSVRIDPSSHLLFSSSIVDSISTLPVNGESSAADLHFIDDNLLLASNRGHDSIAVIEFDAASGSMKLVQHVATEQCPRNFAVQGADLLFVANQNSNSVVTCRRRGKTMFSQTHKCDAKTPVCLVFWNR
jgi:6-phosphogluconolactonase